MRNVKIGLYALAAVMFVAILITHIWVGAATIDANPYSLRDARTYPNAGIVKAMFFVAGILLLGLTGVVDAIGLVYEELCRQNIELGAKPQSPQGP